MVLLPRFSDWRFDAVLSGSMEPVLNVGGMVVIKPVETSEIEIGDIITFYSGESLVTHRVLDVIVGQNDISFTTKGDANEEPDLLPVPANSVVGQVVIDVPYLGYLAAFVKTRLGFMLAIFLPGSLIIASELWSMWRTLLRKDELSSA